MLKGILLGIAMVLPGISGGTAFLILGIYDKIIKDFSRLNLYPYLPFLGGSLIGVFLGSLFFISLFDLARDITVSFLLGTLLASLKIIFKDTPRPSMLRILILFIGAVLGYFFSGEPLVLTKTSFDINNGLLFIGGILSSATMLLPGISGSSVLMVMGIYDDILYFVKKLALSKLLVFGVGSLIGFFLFAKFLEKVYGNCKEPMAFFFAGLIIGSAKILLPSSWHPATTISLLSGIALVWWWNER